MKDTKKTAPKKNNTKSNTRNDSKPKIKEIKFEENFLDEDENEDKRLVVFAVIAILIILATIVTLVIGCEKKDNKEPVKPGEDIVVPDKKEDEDEKEDEGVDTKEVVRKVTSVYRGRRTKESSDDKDKDKTKTDDIVEDEVYYVTYYLNDETEVKEVNEGDKAEEYVPDGYKTCSYYKNEELTEEYDLDEAVTGDINIYMSCSLITYNIVYDQETQNPKTYTVEDSDVTLENESYYGWFSDKELENQVTALNKDIIKLADDTDTIYLYAKLEDTPVDPTEDPTVDPVPCEGETCDVPTTGDAAPTDTDDVSNPSDDTLTTDPDNPGTTDTVTQDDTQTTPETTEPDNSVPCEGDACNTEPENQTTNSGDDNTDNAVNNSIVTTQTVDPTPDTQVTTDDNTTDGDNGKAVVSTPAQPSKPKEEKENENKTEEKPKGDSDDKKPEESKPVEPTPAVEDTESDGE